MYDEVRRLQLTAAAEARLHLSLPAPDDVVEWIDLVG